MTSSQIISLLSIVMFITGSGISFISITNNTYRRLLKVAISFAALMGFLVFIYQAMQPTPYIPAHNPIVYVTNYGECYHEDGCGYLRSKKEINLYDAFMEDYSQCSRCVPPVFTEQELERIEKSFELNGPNLIEFCISFEFIISLLLNIAVFIILEYLKIKNKLKANGHTQLSEMYIHTVILFGIFYSFCIVVILYHLLTIAPLPTIVSIVLLISVAEIIIELIHK